MTNEPSQRSRQLEATNAWAARFSAANIEHVARAVWEQMEPEDRPGDGASWVAGFKSAMKTMMPVVLDLCADNDRLMAVALRAAKLEVPTLIFTGSVASDTSMNPRTRRRDRLGVVSQDLEVGDAGPRTDPGACRVCPSWMRVRVPPRGEAARQAGDPSETARGRHRPGWRRRPVEVVAVSHWE